MEFWWIFEHDLTYECSILTQTKNTKAGTWNFDYEEITKHFRVNRTKCNNFKMWSFVERNSEVSSLCVFVYCLLTIRDAVCMGAKKYLIRNERRNPNLERIVKETLWKNTQKNVGSKIEPRKIEQKENQKKKFFSFISFAVFTFLVAAIFLANVCNT